MQVFSGLLFLLAILSAVGGDGGDPGTAYPPIPLLFTEGTHYGIGYQIVRALVIHFNYGSAYKL